jgi:hypothetical protein
MASVHAGSWQLTLPCHTHVHTLTVHRLGPGHVLRLSTCSLPPGKNSHGSPAAHLQADALREQSRAEAQASHLRSQLIEMMDHAESMERARDGALQRAAQVGGTGGQRLCCCAAVGAAGAGAGCAGAGLGCWC